MGFTYRLFDVNVAATTVSRAVRSIVSAAAEKAGGYACFMNAHLAVLSRQNMAVLQALNESTWTFPDGKPVFLVGKYLRTVSLEKISGPDMLAEIFRDQDGRRLRHYFYGGSQNVLDALVRELQTEFEGCNIVGAVSPPFRPLSDDEQSALLHSIRLADPQIVWVGLGAPKQEIWMNTHSNSIPTAFFMGVGAAFDFHAKVIQRAPDWAQRFGLEWVFRLAQEPRRLWKRYLTTNTLFILYLFLGRKHSSQ